MNTLPQDLRYALRTLRRSPGFTVVAVLTLALGIGVNTTIFSVVNAVLLRPFPQVETEGLTILRTAHLKTGGESSVSWPNFADWRDGSQAFSGMAAYYDTRMILSGSGGDPEEVPVEVVSPNLFDVLGVRPMLGRAFLPGEGERGGEKVVLLTHREWERRFDRDPRVVGSTLSLDGVPHTVIGVMPENFGFPDNQPLWVPLTAPAEPHRGSNYLSVVARLRPGVSLEAAQADLRRVGEEQAARHPDFNAGSGIAAYDFRENWSGDVAAPIWVMMGAVGLVLLIACANVASLLLARGAARRREIAVRVAMGAGRGRLVRQLLTESTLLALLGGALGIVFAVWGLRAILASFPFDPPFWMVFDIDRQVLAFVLAVSLGTGILFGLAPALRATSGDLQGTLRDGGRGAVGARRGRLHGGLVAAELALSVVLLVGAMLMIRSFLHLNAADPGFRTEGAVSMRIATGGTRYEDGEVRAALFRQLLDEARALPGVRSAGMVSALPLSGGFSTSGFDVDRRETPRAERPSTQVRAVSEGFVEAMAIPLVTGRGVTADEARTGAPVAVVNRTLAEQMWPGESAVGHEINVGGPWRTVVGVVGDVSSRHRGDEARPQVYVPTSTESPGWSMTLVVRTASDPAAVVPALRRVLRGIDPSLPLADAATLDEVASRSLWQQRLFGGMFTSFGVIALLLAVTGVYAMMAYAVAQRVHEIGVRMALGAHARQVLRMVVGQGLRLAAVGVAVGLLGAWGLTRVMRGLLVGVSPTDPVTFVAITALLTGVAALASWIPARRAAKVDPMVALRGD